MRGCQTALRITGGFIETRPRFKQHGDWPVAEDTTRQIRTPSPHPPFQRGHSFNNFMPAAILGGCQVLLFDPTLAALAAF